MQLSHNVSAEAGAAHHLYLDTEPVRDAIIAQEQALREIAESGSCVIVSRAAGHVLRENNNLVNVFIHAPVAYRLEQVMKTYGDTKEQGKKNIKRLDAARAAYYAKVSALKWGDAKNYDLCLDSSIGAEKAAAVIVEYAKGV